MIRSQDTEGSLVLQFISLLWSGSRYSGLLCMAASSALYFLMEIFSEAFSGKLAAFSLAHSLVSEF